MTLPDDLREIEEYIYKIECLIGQVAALSAMKAAKGRAEGVRAAANGSGDVLAVLRGLRQQLAEERARREAPIEAELARLFDPPPDLAG